MISTESKIHIKSLAVAEPTRTASEGWAFDPRHHLTPKLVASFERDIYAQHKEGDVWIGTLKPLALLSTISNIPQSPEVATLRDYLIEQLQRDPMVEPVNRHDAVYAALLFGTQHPAFPQASAYSFGEYKVEIEQGIAADRGIDLVRDLFDAFVLYPEKALAFGRSHNAVPTMLEAAVREEEENVFNEELFMFNLAAIAAVQRIYFGQEHITVSPGYWQGIKRTVEEHITHSSYGKRIYGARVAFYWALASATSIEMTDHGIQLSWEPEASAADTPQSLPMARKF